MNKSIIDGLINKAKGDVNPRQMSNKQIDDELSAAWKNEKKPRSGVMAEDERRAKQVERGTRKSVESSTKKTDDNKITWRDKEQKPFKPGMPTKTKTVPTKKSEESNLAKSIDALLEKSRYRGQAAGHGQVKTTSGSSLSEEQKKKIIESNKEGQKKTEQRLNPYRPDYSLGAQKLYREQSEKSVESEVKLPDHLIPISKEEGDRIKKEGKEAAENFVIREHLKDIRRNYPELRNKSLDERTVDLVKGLLEPEARAYFESTRGVKNPRQETKASRPSNKDLIKRAEKEGKDAYYYTGKPGEASEKSVSPFRGKVEQGDLERRASSKIDSVEISHRKSVLDTWKKGCSFVTIGKAVEIQGGEKATLVKDDDDDGAE